MSHLAQEQVREFHEAMDLTIGREPGLRDQALRAALIAEEATETTTAILEGDFIEAIDGLCDLLYVVYGAAITFGIDLQPFFEEVHRSNMTKVGGPVREDGKRLKPETYEPPDIAGILEEEKVRARIRRLEQQTVEARYELLQLANRA